MPRWRSSGRKDLTARPARASAVATGSAFYGYPSKDALVMDFYRRSCDEMQPRIAAALEHVSSLEARSRELIRVKLVHFAPNRGVLRALLRNGADARTCFRPSVRKQRRSVSNIDIAWSGRILFDCAVPIPHHFEPHLPAVPVLPDGRDPVLGYR